jgi:hypothetical protein
MYGTIAEEIINNPIKSVDSEFVTEDTKNKIISYTKFKNMNNKTIDALSLVDDCSKSYDGICSLDKYIEILLENEFIDSSTEQNLSKGHPDHIDLSTLSGVNILQHHIYNIIIQTKFFKPHGAVDTKKFGEYIVNTDGSGLRSNFFTHSNRLFKLKEGALVELEIAKKKWWLEE